jgi:quercetin dioxygenase-like cupin family protein
MGGAEVIHEGDIVRFAPDEEHWHGATKFSEMTHIAIQAGEKVATQAGEKDHFSDWKKPVTKKVYAAANLA